MKCHECKFDVNLKSSYVRPPEGWWFQTCMSFFNLKHGEMIKCDLCIFKKLDMIRFPLHIFFEHMCWRTTPYIIDVVVLKNHTSWYDKSTMMWVSSVAFTSIQSSQKQKFETINSGLKKKRSLSSQDPQKCYVFISGTGSCLFCSWWVDSGRLTTFLVALLGHFVMWPHSISFWEVEWVSDSTKFEKLPLFVRTLKSPTYPHLI